MDGSTAQGRAGGQGGFEPAPQTIGMASTEELVEAIYRLIASSPTPIPVTLMNDGVDETAAIIGAVVERCARDKIPLTEIFIDPDLADFLAWWTADSCRTGPGRRFDATLDLGVKCVFKRLEREPL